MKGRKGIVAAVLLVALAAVGVSLWITRARQSTPTLASSFAQKGAVTVRVDRFERTWTESTTLRKLPPPWIARYPFLLRGWMLVYRETKQVQDGLVIYVVEASVAAGQPLQTEDINYRLDYGAYGIGANERSIKTEPGQPYVVGTRFEVTDGPVPVALEIAVKGEWFRFPITQRR